MGFPQDLIDSLLIGLGFFYKALWPILLGVFITALIDTLVNKDKMADILGGRDLLTNPSVSPDPTFRPAPTWSGASSSNPATGCCSTPTESPRPATSTVSSSASTA
jgi:hypothetical protein